MLELKINPKSDKQIIWLASYPKSGNTWLRFLLVNLLYGKPKSGRDIDHLIPDLHPNSDEIFESFFKIKDKNNIFIKTHSKFTNFHPFFEKTLGSIYIVRNPIDVMISNWNYFVLTNFKNYNFQNAKREKNQLFQKYINNYLQFQGDLDWINHNFGSWNENVESWIQVSNKFFPTLVIKYEELLSNPELVVKQICDFLCLEFTSEEITQAIQNSSFAEMKKIEENDIKNQIVSSLFYTPEYQSAHEAGIRFMSKGKSRNGKQDLTSAQLQKGMEVFGDLMKELDYLPEENLDLSMSNSESSAQSLNQDQAQDALINRDYNQAISLYEARIEKNSSNKSNYWYLGLCYLLQGQEAEAQTTWMFALMEEEDEDKIEQYTQELVAVLNAEAIQQEQAKNYEMAWGIRHHIQEINPEDINNLFNIIKLSIYLENFNPTDLTDFGILELLKSKTVNYINSQLLLEVLGYLLQIAPINIEVIEFAELIFPYLEDNQVNQYVDSLMLTATHIGYNGGYFEEALRYAHFCEKVNPQNLRILTQISSLYQTNAQYDQGIESANKLYRLSQTVIEKVHANLLILKGFLQSGGRWQESLPIAQRQKNLLEQLFTENPQTLHQIDIRNLHNMTFYFPYLQDTARETRLKHNQLMDILQSNFCRIFSKQLQDFNSILTREKKSKKLKIGYLSHCFRRHSVGWLSRWLIQHHNREEFEIYGYLVNYNENQDDILQDFFVNAFDTTYKLGSNSLEIAQKINQDKIDILVELDSITGDVAMEVMMLKPAPIQVTWLGWDGSGIPNIDYYIADNYVLQADAQDYYKEKIWRLPTTYIAVDGFDVGVPDLRRQDLDIPENTVIYFSAQGGCKRHPDMIRLQMKILKEVPNSYFLIKGLNTDKEAVAQFFSYIAEEEGVNPNRLRFLEPVVSEATHRANLGVADVVLDTYPYNGATTTLETLWMEVPLVTKVGEQFAARNSYTMMINAGIEEGIAWNDEEYIEWGIKLGQDINLRKQVSWKLRKSKQSAPLWQGKQFAQEMEKAYQEMWQQFQE